MKTKQTVGDWRKWLTEDLFKNLERVINAKSAYPAPYYIEVRCQKNYRGQPLGNVGVNPTADKSFEGKKLIHVMLICMNNPPRVPQLGTMLFKVDNRRGSFELCYALPQDMPNTVEDSDNYGPVVRRVAEAANKFKIPLAYN